MSDKRCSKAAPRPTRDIYPLDAPGMPLPGVDFMQFAEDLGDETEIKGKGKDAHFETVGDLLPNLYRDILYSNGRFTVPMTNKGRKRMLPVVTGHFWGDDTSIVGPAKRTKVMVIGKMLGEDEVTQRRNLVGPSGQLLADACEKLALDGVGWWYITNLLKTQHPGANNGETTLRVPWIKEWLPILHQELRLLRPKYILCLGADASKALLGKKATVKHMEGRVVEYKFPISRKVPANGEVPHHKSLVMTILHPAWILRTPEDTDKFENTLSRFGQLTNGNRWDKEEEGLDHRVIDSLDELKDLYFEIESGCEDNLLGIDAEWHGEHPQNKGSYMRSVQLSWKHKTAVCISLRHLGGKWRFQGARMKTVAKWIMKICKGRRLAGQFFNADMEWLTAVGIDLREQFRVADTWEETMTQAMDKENPQGGFDTGLAIHAINETDDFSLTSQALRYTSAPRYDVALTEWRDHYCNERKLKKEEMEGYGECPNSVLEPYACYDADVTRRLVASYQKLLTSDRFHNNCWEAFWMSMRAVPAVYEINTEGVIIDRDRLDKLTKTYISSKAKLEERIRTWTRWPEFNLNSVYQIREFLFGEQFNGKIRNPDDPYVRLRPKHGRSLKLEPILTTDKRPMPWPDVVARRLEDQKTAGTDKMVLAILAQESQGVSKVSAKTGQMTKYDFSKQITWIRDYRFISQVLKSTLRIPKIDKDTQDFITDGAGYYVYPGGLPAAICDDGRARTHMYQTKETGRWASARPPLHNLSKRREVDYKRILGDDYLWPLRTVIKAPEGSMLIESDYTGAELFGMALMSGDKRMIEHAQRNLLPETHPDYYDIHSHVAVSAFGLKCKPTKGGLKSIGKGHWRILAKSVIFGIAYGRGAKAIALAAKEEGIYISVDEAQQVIEAIFKMYPKLTPFFNACKKRSKHPRWLCGCFGRFRRFPVAVEYRTLGEFERQAMNFPIQGMIADAVSRAVDHLGVYRTEHPEIKFKLVLQIHDAVLLEVPYEHIPAVIDKVLPECMTNRVPIYPSDTAGIPTGAGPYYLGTSTDPFLYWGEQLYPADCMKRGVHPKYAGWSRQEGGWTHPQIEDKIWRGNKKGGKLFSIN